MAKSNAKRDAVVAQVEELRKAGYIDEDIRRKLKNFGLNTQQLDDVLPSTKAKPVQVEKAPRDRSMDKDIISDCVHFLKGISPRVSSLDFKPGLLSQDAMTWARKLEGLL